MREGSLEAPTRHPIPWRDAEWYDEEKLDAELRRVFDICHGCRRCFNLCDSFPRLFDLIDESESGELEAVPSSAFKPVVDACTLCDMCFLTKCPYVPPHEFNLDFPHLMLRYRAVESRKGNISFAERQLTKTDRNGKIACTVAPIANWASGSGNAFGRSVLQSLAGVHKKASLPQFHGKTFVARAKSEPVTVNEAAPAFGRKAVIYATCFSNYNNPDIGMDLRAVLARNGVETEVLYPNCCGMPQLEHGDMAKVAAAAEKLSAAFAEWIDNGYDIISLVPSCTLMMKFEWPLILPENEAVRKLSAATFDASEYVVSIAKKEGLAEGLLPLEGGVTVHIACHARAQNMGQKAAEMLRLLPETKVSVIERCSGHGGSWGVLKDNFEIALKVGKPVFKQAVKNAASFVVSECPLAREHIVQGMGELGEGGMPEIKHASHPVQLIARAYGI